MFRQDFRGFRVQGLERFMRVHDFGFRVEAVALGKECCNLACSMIGCVACACLAALATNLNPKPLQNPPKIPKPPNAKGLGFTTCN